jgi:hypothetical protein
MSRQQQAGVLSTANANQATNETNAQSEFGDTQNAIGNYNNQLAKFVSGNPYTAGGEYDSTINTGLANTSDAGSNSLKGALQSQSLRTGQNSAADAATAASGAQANTRDLSSSMATAQQGRIGAEAGYNQTALGASSTPIGANQSLYGTASGAAQGDLGTAASTAATPGFWDTLGDSLASTPGDFASGVGKGVGTALGAQIGCWVAAELYGGWDDSRVILLREWIFGPFQRESRIGYFLAAFYIRHGFEIAAAIRRNRVLRKCVKMIFDKALVRAQEWK